MTSNNPSPVEGEAPLYKFGDYCIIEQHRFAADNEMYLYKVVTSSKSNCWVDVPVMRNAEETMHDEMEDVTWCICCGVMERTALKYRTKDILPATNAAPSMLSELTDLKKEVERLKEALILLIDCCDGNYEEAVAIAKKALTPQ